MAFTITQQDAEQARLEQLMSGDIPLGDPTEEIKNKSLREEFMANKRNNPNGLIGTY